MRYCSYCKQKVDEDSLSCRYCGEEIISEEAAKWYFSVWLFITVFICIGPLAFPLLWFNPRSKISLKIIVTIFLTILWLAGAIVANMFLRDYLSQMSAILK